MANNITIQTSPVHQIIIERVGLQGGKGEPGLDGVQSSDNSVTNIRAMTQGQYDLLSPPDPKTFYIIKSNA